MKNVSRRKKDDIKGSLDWWVQEMWRIYKKWDEPRHPALMWISVVEHASSIAEDIRRSSFGTLPRHLAHSFAWIASFVAKCNHDTKMPYMFRFKDGFSDVVAFKYPKVCGLCKQGSCVCSLVRSAIESVNTKKAMYEELLAKRTTFMKENGGYRRKNVDDWVGMFAGIYGNTIKGLSFENIVFHFMEEVGEVAKAIATIYEKHDKISPSASRMDTIEILVRSYAKPNTSVVVRKVMDLKLELIAEIADCFSWWAALCIKLKQLADETTQLGTGPLNAGTILCATYPNDGRRIICFKCKQSPCKCPVQLLSSLRD